jgi:macrolide-specific efflux system membrane fusion protein
MSVEELFTRLRSGAAPQAGRPARQPLLWAVGVAVLLGVGALYYEYRHHGDAAVAGPVLVSAQRGDVEEVVSAVGILQPFATVDVGAQVTGQLKTLYVHVGDEVKKGDPLADIDSQVAAARVDADNANLKNLQAQLADKQSSLALATAQASRQSHLRTAGATSQDAYDTAQAALRSAEAQVKALSAQLTASQSSLKADQATLGYARIYAPMTGTVTAVPAKEGQTLNASQTAPVILTLSDLTTMTVNTQVSEADVPKLHVGMTVYFTTLGDRHRRYPAKLRQILLTPTTVNNVVLYTALFDIPNPGRTLLPQMTAQVFFVLAAAHDVVTLPVSAIKFDDDGDAPKRGGAGKREATVTVLTASGDKQDRHIVLGISNRIDAEIVSGLQPGDKVIAAGGGA